MFSRFLKIIFVCFIVLQAGIIHSFAGEIDLLVNKLVEKGVLTPGEAQQLITETKEDARKEIAAGKSASVPQWVQDLKLKGDFRLRYEGSERKAVNSQARDRGRIRMRLGAETRFQDKFKVALGLATGNSNDARSTNQTMDTTFAKKSLWVDYAYAQYSPFSWVALTGGRMKNPLWEPGDLLWDTDINPEGGAAQLSYQLNPRLGAFFNAAAYSLQESSSNTADPYMAVFQPGLQLALNNTISAKLAALYTYFGTDKVVLDGRSSPATNTTRNSQYAYKFNSISPAMEIGFQQPLSGVHFLPRFVDIPYVGLFGEYLHNPDPDDENIGYLAGVTIGYPKVEGKNQWQGKYMYRRLERNAWPDSFPDSDAYSGATDIKGHEAILVWGLGKNTNLAFDYYRTERISSPHSHEHVMQVDWNVKF